MNFKKKLIIYGSVLGGLAVLFILGNIVALASVTPQGENVFAGLKVDAVEKITVADKDGQIELKRSGEGWTVVSGTKTYEATKDVIDSLLNNFAYMHKKSTASSSRDTWGSFSVDEASAVHITLFDTGNHVLADAFLGKGGSTSFSQYIRLPEKDDVIQINQRIEKTTKLKDWVNRRLFPDFSAAEVASVAVNTHVVFNDNAEALSRNISFTLVQGEKDKDGKETWSLREDERFPLATSPVNGFVSSISRFTADNVVEDPEQLSLDPEKPLGSIVVNMKTGSSYALFLMGMSTTEDNVFYVTNQGQKTIYTSGKWTLKDLFRQGVDKFIDTEALLNPTRKE